MLEDVLRQIGQRERFVLTSHARPDGDAVGSALACCQVLREMGKQADVVLHDGVPRIYRSLPFADQVVQDILQIAPLPAQEQSAVRRDMQAEPEGFFRGGALEQAAGCLRDERDDLCRLFPAGRQHRRNQGDQRRRNYGTTPQRK